MAQRVESGCRDCKKCTNSGVANLGRNSGRLGAGIMTFGMSEAVMAGTKNCRVCGHKLSLHSGTDEVLVQAGKRADKSPRRGTPAGWYPVGGGVTRYWDGSAWGQTASPVPVSIPVPDEEPDDSAAGELARLVEMHQQGHLTDEEFTAAKRAVLGL